MNMITRRNLLQSVAVVPVLAPALGAAGKSLPAIGVQLYTARDLIAQGQASEVIRTLDEIGYREAEAIWASLDDVWPSLSKSRLKPVSIHMDSGLFTAANRPKLAAAIEKVKKLGFEYMVYPAVPRPERTAGMDHFKALATMLNEVGGQCARAGLKLCYHNHAFEFQTIGSSTPWEAITTGTDPKLVAFELDIFWVSVAGHDPVEFLRRYQGRFQLLHVKNKPRGMSVQFNENVQPDVFKEVGEGILPIPAILRAALDTGVKHFFVEQDRTPGNPLDSLRRSYAYLDKLTL